MTKLEDADKPATFREVLREGWGCPKARRRWWSWHVFQWGFGPQAHIRGDGLVLDEGGGWWMYCAQCGKGIWR